MKSGGAVLIFHGLTEDSADDVSVRRGNRSPFLTLLQTLKAELQKRADQGIVEFSIVTFCKSGRHRAVGVARIVRHLLSRDRRYEVDEPVHLNRTAWPRWFCHGTCHECAHSHPRKAAALDVALRLWRNL